MTNVVRNTIRILRGVFVLRLFMVLFSVLVFAVWLAPTTTSEALPHSALSLRPLLLPSPIAAVFVLLPAFERRFKRYYLPIALALTIIAFSLEYGVYYLNPNAGLRLILPGGQELSVFRASTEMVLLVLIPCLLAGMAYGTVGAVLAATFATVIHLALGVAAYTMGTPLHGYLILLPLRLGVLYGFPAITGILADTWQREHTALRRANQQIRGYAATIEQLATSRERVRLARAMHDTLAHSLAALVIQLEAIDALQDIDPDAARTQLAKVRREARLGLDETRQAILDLRSLPVEDMGLPGALAKLVGQFGQDNGLHTDWNVTGTPVTLLPVQANALYRIAEEALDNVARHADASEVQVALDYADGVMLTVRDDGIGFNTQAVEAGRYGLVGIRERAALVGGQVDVRSMPDHGTQITVRIAEQWGK